MPVLLRVPEDTRMHARTHSHTPDNLSFYFLSSRLSLCDSFCLCQPLSSFSLAVIFPVCVCSSLTHLELACDKNKGDHTSTF